LLCLAPQLVENLKCKTTITCYAIYVNQTYRDSLYSKLRKRISSEYCVNFVHCYVGSICESISLEMTYISRVVPVKARDSDNCDSPCTSYFSSAC